MHPVSYLAATDKYLIDGGDGWIFGTQQWQKPVFFRNVPPYQETIE
jgi:hypothetical protein